MSKCEHVELATDDPKRAREFYASLFSWKLDAMPDGSGGEYLLFRTDNGGGGITAKMSPQQPTAWMPYFTVASVNDTLAAATRLGAAVMLPFTSIGDMGAIAVMRDPTGASFGVWEMVAPPPPAKPVKKAAAAKPAAKPAPKKAAPKKAAPKKAAAKPAPKAKAKKKR